jgi:hypothetical protein
MGLFNKFKKKKPEKKTMTSVSFVLLEKAEVDFKQLAQGLFDDWNISIDEQEIEKDAIVTQVDEMMVAVSFINAPIPNGEAVEASKTNRLWPEAVEVAEKHVAQLLVAILPGEGKSLLDVANLYVKICSSCLKLPYATGINTLGTVLEPSFYIDAAVESIAKGEFPIFNLVFFGIYTNDEKTWSAYTYGLEDLGKQELEVIDSLESGDTVLNMLSNITAYIMDSDVTLKHGETVGYTPQQKLTITESKGVAVAGKSLKIGF